MTESPTDLQVQHVADDPNSSATIYRILHIKHRIVYISIDAGVFDGDDYCFPPALISHLPPFPPGKWNNGHITITEENPEPHFTWTRYVNLPTIISTWHDRFVDYNSLHFAENLRKNVCIAFHHELGEIIAKFAVMEWEVQYHQAETEAYHWIEGHDIGPCFLGHLTEDGRVIGFLLEKLDGLHASIGDLTRCQEAVRKLHSLGIRHGDLNCDNFIVRQDRVTLIDFESATKCHDEAEMAVELEELNKELTDISDKGGQGYRLLDDIQDQH